MASHLNYLQVNVLFAPLNAAQKASQAAARERVLGRQKP